MLRKTLSTVWAVMLMITICFSMSENVVMAYEGDFERDIISDGVEIELVHRCINFRVK